MSFKTTGVISHISPTEKVSQSFQKREVWLESMDGKYENVVAIQFTQARCDLPESYAEGELVTIHFDLRGSIREYNGTKKCYTNLNGWKIERPAPEHPVEPRPQSVQPHTPAPVAPGDEMPGADDDLPF